MIDKIIIKFLNKIITNYKITSILIIILTIILSYITFNKANINTSLTVLLPSSKKSVINLKKLKKMKGSTDSFILLLASDDIKLSKSFSKEISSFLKNDKLVASIDAYKNIKFLKDRLLLQLSVDDLINIKNKIKNEVSDFKIKKVTNLIDIDEGDDLDDDDSKNPNEGDPFKKKTSKNNKLTKNNEKKMSFEEIQNKFDFYINQFSKNFKEWDLSKDKKVLIIKINPSKTATDYDFALKFKNHLDTIISSIKNKHPEYKNIKIKYSGPYIMVIEETEEIQKNVVSSIGLSLFLIFLLLFFYFGRIKILITLFIPLILGIIWTSGVFFIFNPFLNMIAAFIFTILLGLGIDFGIHVLTRYFVERKNNTVENSIIISLKNTGKAVSIGAFTTIMAFLALIFAEFKGFSQFGQLAAIGIALNLLAIYLVLPIIIIIIEKNFGGFNNSINYYVKLYNKVIKKDFDINFLKYSKIIMIFFSVFTIIMVLDVIENPPQFELNFSKLSKEISKGRKEILKYTKDIESKMTPIVIISKTKAENDKILKELNNNIKFKEITYKQPSIFPLIKSYNLYRYENNSKSIDFFASIYSFYPKNQKKKEELIKNINQMLKKSRIKNLSPDKQDFIKKIRPFLINAKSYKINDLPEFIKDIFIDNSGSYDHLIFLYTKLDTSDGKNAILLSKDINKIKVDGNHLNVTGQDLIFADILLLMLSDSVKVSSLAFIFIFLILLLSNRSLKLTITQLIPLIIGLLLSVYFLNFFNVKLNFFNMSVIPALIGMGIDNSVHISLSIKEENKFNVIYGYKKVFASITMATITTIIGFSGLLTASQKGLNSIGKVAIIGMSSIWIITVIFMPAFIQFLKLIKGNYDIKS